MAVAKSGVPQREAAFEARTLPDELPLPPLPCQPDEGLDRGRVVLSIEQQAPPDRAELTIASKDERSSAVFVLATPSSP